MNQVWHPIPFKSAPSVFIWIMLVLFSVSAAEAMHLIQPAADWIAHPLEEVSVADVPGTTLVVRDGQGRIYQQLAAASRLTFIVGGALGTQRVEALDSSGKRLDALTFQVEAETSFKSDAEAYPDLFRLALKTMKGEHGDEQGADGTGSIVWHDRTYKFFVPWILDHSHTTKGMQYFSAAAAGLVDLMSEAQKNDGMIWSFVQKDHGPEHSYHYWAYREHGYAKVDGGVLFARQPVENHNEGNFVDALYYSWKGNGDDQWMASHLDSAKRALDYSMNSPVRWSRKHELLKRGYTIDSWDFQPHDQYLVPFRMGAGQQIDPEKTKWTIFFGDNTAYAHACDQLAEMMEVAGRKQEAAQLRERGRSIRERLDRLAWNGKYYAHHIEEDPDVKRNFGVDEWTQLAMSNMYALNRGVTHSQAVSIINAYLDLGRHLPSRSPGEWYSVYPPYERGFEKDNGRWEYMNAGVHAHAAGELARGAFENGYEKYGAQILSRLRELGRRYGDKIYFAYTGAYEPAPPAPQFQPVDISSLANMDIHSKGTTGVPGWMGLGDEGNDMRNLPTGQQTLRGIPFEIPDPLQNGRRAAIGISSQNKALPPQVEVLLKKKAAAIYLLHAAESKSGSGIVAGLRFEYADGTHAGVYIVNGRNISYWWFPTLKAENAGIAWRGANGVVGDVGVSWAAIPNPSPEKVIDRITFNSSLEGNAYAVMGITLADRMEYHEPGGASYGGPDNWSGALVMYALMEGLAGIKDEATCFHSVRLSPHWIPAGARDAAITARYPASQGYVSYHFHHDPENKMITLKATGNGDRCQLRLLLPEGIHAIKTVQLDDKPVEVQMEQIENSFYAILPISLVRPVEVKIHY
jgi:hypothetical protein